MAMPSSRRSDMPRSAAGADRVPPSIGVLLARGVLALGWTGWQIYAGAATPRRLPRRQTLRAASFQSPPLRAPSLRPPPAGPPSSSRLRRLQPRPSVLCAAAAPGPRVTARRGRPAGPQAAAPRAAGAVPATSRIAPPAARVPRAGSRRASRPSTISSSRCTTIVPEISRTRCSTIARSSQRNELNAQAHNNLGLLYQEKNLLQESARELQRAILIEPRNAARTTTTASRC